MMRPVLTREAYLKSRGNEKQKAVVKAVREGDEQQKRHLVQMNYSCLPNEDGSLKGSTRMSTTVGMDIDHVPAEEMQVVKERILAKKDELGLLMLELSARAQGYHLVFKRKPELSQEENLEWASELLEVEFDKGAKDITRVFFTTTDSEEDLIYLDDEIFETTESISNTDETDRTDKTNTNFTNNTNLQLGVANEKNPLNPSNPCSEKENSCNSSDSCSEKEYNGIPYSDIVAKYWELFNEGKEPVDGDRNVLTFELAATIRSICSYSLEKLMTVIPNYWAKPDGTCSQ